jgi:dephospho-CoA kinase
MFVVGVTGEFGSGKSTVSGLFSKRGARVIDADKLVHELLQRDARCHRQIRAAFGKEVLSPRGVDRRKLAEIVFNDPRALFKLEKIIHPLAQERVAEFLKRSRSRVVILDVPLLIEAGWAGMVDALIVVKAGRKAQIDRLQKRTGLSRREIMARLKRQMPARDKVKYADIVIDNRLSLADTDRQVQKIWDQWTRPTQKQEQ